MNAVVETWKVLDEVREESATVCGASSHKQFQTIFSGGEHALIAAISGFEVVVSDTACYKDSDLALNRRKGGHAKR